MSRGRLRTNMSSRSTNPGRCRSKDNAQNVEVIDLDSVDADVVIIDVPGSSRRRSKFDRKDATSSPNCVISIDDDDSDETGTDSPSETSGSQYGHHGNRYGLDCTSETESLATGTSRWKDSSGVGSSDGEDSDCEILDDSSGSIRQEWERAHLRKTVPPDSFQTTHSENVEFHLNKSFVDSFNYCFGESSSSNKFGFHKDGADFSVPNADSSGNISKEDVSAKHQHWYEKEYRSFVPGTHQEEIRERVPPFFVFKPCSDKKRNNVFSGNGARSSEEKVVGEDITKDANNDAMYSEKLAEDEITKETDNSSRSPEKMNVEEVNVKEASMDMANEMSGKGNEKGEPSIDIEQSLMQNGDLASEANRHGEKFGEESILVSAPEANTEPEPEHDECLFGDREKHKESDEYRRAAEEEWASRQKQLRIQSEEAQRLKKRKKAETLRLLDMERRQKQRLEEMRENQKKNEETLGLKEELRSEVRKDLERMEKTHRDMASILRGLGIPVAGGLFPSSNQVKSAYKQALLKFHPDRVQASDVRQQVRAEETFKFISRVKEKLLPAA